MSVTTKVVEGPVTIKSEDRGEISAVFATLEVIDRDGDYTARGLIEPLDELVARDGPDMAQYVEGTADLWVGDDGMQYGLPKDFDAARIFYNAGMATEAGLTPEQLQNLTWNPHDGGTYEDPTGAPTEVSGPAPVG